MKKFKKAIILTMLVIFASFFAACGKDSTNNSGTKEDMAGNTQTEGQTNGAPGDTGAGAASNPTDNGSGSNSTDTATDGGILEDAGNAVGDMVDDAANGVENITDDIVGQR